MQLSPRRGRLHIACEISRRLKQVPKVPEVPEVLENGGAAEDPLRPSGRSCPELVGEHFTLTPVSSTGQALTLSLRERGLSIPQIGSD